MLLKNTVLHYSVLGYVLKDMFRISNSLVCKLRPIDCEVRKVCIGNQNVTFGTKILLNWKTIFLLILASADCNSMDNISFGKAFLW